MSQPRTFVLMVLALGAGALLYAACGNGSTKTCAQSCPGCCDSTGTCQTGTTASVCGTAGGACSACSASQTCQAGVCQGNQTNDSGTTDSGTGDSGSNADSGSADAGPTDAGTTSCPPEDAGTVCVKDSQCTGGTVCCFDIDAGGATCQTCCPSRDEVACNGPTDCTGGDLCCLRVPLNGGAWPNCNIVGAGTTCQPSANCPYQVPQESITCAGPQDELTLCLQPSDCQLDAGYKCCSFNFPGSNVTEQVCADAFAQEGGTCLM
jgi:hypothetical protein